MKIRLRQISDGVSDLTDGPIIIIETDGYSDSGYYDHRRFHRMPRKALSADGRSLITLDRGYIWYESWHETAGAWEEIGYPG